MNFSNVKLIFAREMRDQLRDRRTLFLIAILPLLLYPMLGMSFFQLSQFLRNTAAKVMIVGDQELAEHTWLPPLVGESQFDAALFPNNPDEIDNLQLVDVADVPPSEGPSKQIQPSSLATSPLQTASAALEAGKIQVVLYFPPGFGERLQAARESLIDRSNDTVEMEQAELPKPQIFYKSANEKSRVAQMRVERVLRTWRTHVMQTNLRDSNVPLEAAQPFELLPQDVSQERQRHAAVWSKILPFVLFIWALTGAFYPAVDLCAGEKERGTLETLLASPAQRREIVWGKLLTIMSFSIVTAMLNLGSLGLTGKFVLAQFQQLPSLSGQDALSMPPLISVVWLAVALLPVAALFSALCLACAAFARSTKEGQYYLMPLLLIVMPLMMLPMSPGVELNLGNSLIPVTGVVLLLRSVIEGQYWQAMPYIVPVAGVTLMCCLLAIRWAEEQFNRESVLFRESERLDLGRWVVHLVRDRAATPTFAQAVLCVALIMVVQFFVKLAISSKAITGVDFRFLVQSTFISQVVCIALPALLLTLFFTRQRKKTLLLDKLPRWQLVMATLLLAVLVRPLGIVFAAGVQQLYPPSSTATEQIKVFADTIGLAPNWWSLLLLIAILPALCEELAFRGFVLSGLRHIGHKWWAIGLSAVAFGMVHSILQQQIAAAAVGLVLGYLAVQTGSLLLCMIFHAVYNGLGLALPYCLEQADGGLGNSPLSWLFNGSETWIFEPWVLGLSALGTAAILWWLHRLPYQRTNEEQLQEARQRQLVGA